MKKILENIQILEEGIDKVIKERNKYYTLSCVLLTYVIVDAILHLI